MMHNLEPIERFDGWRAATPAPVHSAGLHRLLRAARDTGVPMRGRCAHRRNAGTRRARAWWRWAADEDGVAEMVHRACVWSEDFGALCRIFASQQRLCRFFCDAAAEAEHHFGEDWRAFGGVASVPVEGLGACPVIVGDDTVLIMLPGLVVEANGRSSAMTAIAPDRLRISCARVASAALDAALPESGIGYVRISIGIADDAGCVRWPYRIAIPGSIGQTECEPALFVAALGLYAR